MFEFLKRRRAEQGAEPRAALPDGSGYVSESTGRVQFFGMDMNSAGEPVTVETALGVPSIFAAVNFLSGTLASLPIGVYKRATDGSVQKTDSDITALLNEAPNSGMSSFTWRKHGFDQTFTGGRQLTFIERDGRGQIIALWPLDPDGATVVRKDGVVTYTYRENRKVTRYDASEIIDIPFMLKANGLLHRSPIMSNAEVVGMAIAATKYGGAYFRSGGVPPFAIEGGFQSAGAMSRAADDFDEAVKKSAKDKRQVLVLPTGLTIKTIGTDAEKAQLIETQRFLVEQVARIYGLPPVFLQDLTHGTFANVEQQDLHFAKHVLRRWVKQFEDELNLKLFGWKVRDQFVKVNLDGLLRGDFKTRMEGYASGIQSGVLTPNEARGLEDRAPLDGGDGLFMQGAMLPIGQLGQSPDGGTAESGNAA